MGRTPSRQPRRAPTEAETIETMQSNPAKVAQAAFELQLPEPEFSNDRDRAAFRARRARQRRLIGRQE